ncbi:MAG: murein biosynthesis integral membrane protein MurJ [Lachnospiraceae bacterium]|nr:murein biosynthesis integral membrane protein MurJ [Lachnospiraceae bacterium]
MDNSIGKRVFRGTIIIVLIGILAKLAAFLSEVVLAAYLGTNYRSDAYYMVSSIQQVIYPMLSVGIWKVFLPVYKEKITQGYTEQAYELTNKAISFFTVISIAVVAMIMVLTGPVVSIVAPGFEGETRELCIKLVRISSPMYVFIIASAVYASILQSHNKFLGSQIREVASHIPTILAAIFFYNKFGIETMAIALVVGGAVRLIIELPFVDWGYKYKPDLKFRTKEFLTMLKRLPSALISEGVTQLNTLIDKAMASTLPEGTISGLNYGHRLMNVFSGLLSTAIATALYPQMIELIALKKEQELSKLVVKIINIFCVLMVPVTLACVLFRNELVAAVFQRGSFTAESTLLTSGVFALYSLGIFFIACNTVITNLFYGYGNTKTPMYISIANLVINVLLNLILIHLWGVNGLALATSLSAIITFFVRIKAAEKYVKLDNKKMIVTAVKVLIASAVACVIPRAILWMHPMNKFLVLMISAIIGVVVYLLAVKVMRVTEINDLIGLLKRKMKKT